MGYCVSTDVAALCSHIVAGSADFGTQTNPTKAQVETFISAGSAYLNTWVKGMGYSPPGSTLDLYDLFRQMNALYAAALAERRRTVDQTAPGEKTRADHLWNDFKFMQETVADLDLSAAGLSGVNTAGPYVGGVVVSDVDAWKDDTTIVQPRFSRGQTRFTDTLLPNGTSASG